MKKFNQLCSKHMLFVGMVCSIVVLPGCSLKEWFGGSKAGDAQDVSHAVEKSLAGDVLVSMDGKALVTTESLKKDKADLLKSNPQLKMMLPHMDEKQFEKTLVDGLTNQAMVEKDIRDKKLDQTQEYKDELALMIKSIKHMFNNKVFSAQLKPNVTDADVVTFYEQNKDKIPTLVVSQGGVKAVGVEFDTEDAAKDFATKVQSVGNNVQKAAQAAKIADKVKDFKAVHDQSVGIDNALRTKIVATTKFPSTVVHQVSDKSYWVVAAMSKEAPTYQPLEKIKGELRQYLEKEKLTELVDKELTELRKKYNVVVNEAFFAPTKEELTQASEQNVEEFEAAVEQE